jgi:hypothetical protein
MSQAATAANKARRIAKEAAKQKRDAALRFTRKALRKLGALRRIDRRIAASESGFERSRLQAVRVTVLAAMTASAEAA